MNSNAQRKSPQWAFCVACGHAWVVAYLPMEVGRFAKLLKGACCPRCGASSKDARLWQTGIGAPPADVVAEAREREGRSS